MESTVSQKPATTAQDLIPEPQAIQVRLAEIARERTLLRALLRVALKKAQLRTRQQEGAAHAAS